VATPAQRCCENGALHPRGAAQQGIPLRHADDYSDLDWLYAERKTTLPAGSAAGGQADVREDAS
jgi:hypothetical protein